MNGMPHEGASEAVKKVLSASNEGFYLIIYTFLYHFCICVYLTIKKLE